MNQFGENFGRIDGVRLLKIVAPFMAINAIVSLAVVAYPLAMPIFCAEFCLLAVWSAWGPGDFWQRFSTCLMVGAALVFSQLYLIVVACAVYGSARPILIMVQWLFSAWIVAQVPLWIMRFVWQWRITNAEDRDLERLSMNDNIIGMTMICVALASWRWATDSLVAQFGPFGLETATQFYLLAIGQLLGLIALTVFAFYLSIKLQRLSAKIVPLLVSGFAYAIVTSWLWFSPADQWIATGIIWFATIVFVWAVLLTVEAIRKTGFELYRGRQNQAVGDSIANDAIGINRDLVRS